MPNGELVVHPPALTLAQDFATGNSWLLGVGPGYLPFQYPATLGLAPSDGARVRLFRFTHHPSTPGFLIKKVFFGVSPPNLLF